MSRKRCSESTSSLYYSNCIRIDLSERFKHHDDYQQTSIEGSRFSQIVVPKIVGYHVSYTGLLLILTVDPPREGPFDITFDVEHAFVTNLKDRKQFKRS